MAESKGVDGDLIRADADAGMSQTAIAARHGVARAMVHHHLRAKSSAVNGNGSRGAPEGSELAALKALVAAEWEKLPVVERLRLLLSRGSA